MDRHHLQQAAEWFIKLENGTATPAMREEFTRWLLLTPDNIHAFLEISRLMGDVDSASRDMSTEKLVEAARAQSERSNVVPIGAAEPVGVKTSPGRAGIGNCCVIAVTTAATLASIMAISWLTRDHWLCRPEVAQQARSVASWISDAISGKPREITS